MQYHFPEVAIAVGDGTIEYVVLGTEENCMSISLVSIFSILTIIYQADETCNESIQEIVVLLNYAILFQLRDVFEARF